MVRKDRRFRLRTAHIGFDEGIGSVLVSENRHVDFHLKPSRTTFVSETFPTRSPQTKSTIRPATVRIVSDLFAPSLVYVPSQSLEAGVARKHGFIRVRDRLQMRSLPVGFERGRREDSATQTEERCQAD